MEIPISFFISSCQQACPLLRSIQRHNILLNYLGKLIKVGLAKEEIFLRVYDELFNFNPLFGICGYICGICEDACKRKEIDEGVGVRFVERFVFDWYKNKVEKGQSPPYRPIDIALAKDNKVAIVGGGPAGLTASFFLAKEGYKITLFETKSKLGGALRFIPSFRLPKEVLDFAIDQMIKPLAIDVKLHTKIDINELKKNGYKAIFIATGTPLPRSLPSFVSDYKEAETAIDVLSQISEGMIDKDKYKGRKVVVIGGSGVAIDTARSLRRLGAEVALACLESADRTSKDGILANIEDEKAAIEEGIGFYYSRGLDEVKKQDNKLHLCLCFCFCVYDLKDGERIFNPKFNHKDTISLRCDYIVFAIGQLADRKYFKELLDEKGRLKADPLTLATSKEGIFVGGDALRIGRACEAIKAGKQAAESIKMYLEKKDLKTKRQSKQYINPNLAYEKKHIPFKASERPPYLKVEERLASFALEQGGFSLEQLILETERCLHCGSCDNCKACISLGFRENLSKIEVIEQRCDGCGYCVDVCVYEAIKIIEYIKEAQIKKTIEVNLDLCRGCGLCQATCPKEGCLIPGFSLAQLKERIESYLNEHYKS